MSCHGLPKLVVCWPSRHQLMLALLPYLAFRVRWLCMALPGWRARLLLTLWPAMQRPALPLSACHAVTAHTPLRCPTPNATAPPISALPLPPPASSHSSPHARTAVVHTAVSRCLVRTAPGYNARSPPGAAAASYLPPC